ncbi:DsbA family oxidoreductase [Streptomyces sp. UNOC14_S4]|uniref:DsbA family oxidoreductase n=1 Tax=Streptomyces sp. UNOC14_S4 TaxID=2872340 RepID=UPI001E2C3F39|nr:DsbA family oxidoreductase [Streptomyces sp. UNOC14_S4]MCC3766423.1 DsbA family oxidoreductase [Streptomyces sp. UNOC14_S4]
MGDRIRIDVYSDISCPWCYIGKRNLEKAVAAFGADRVELVPHPYQIDGEHPEHAMPMLEWLAGKYGTAKATAMSEEVTEAGKALGITFRNASGYAVDTLRAHRLLWLAGRRHGAAVRSRLEELLFAAYFTENGDVSDPELLVDRAVRAGMDGAEAAAYLASDEELAEVRAAVAAAREQVATVPAFVLGDGTTLVGAQDEATFLRALRQAADRA